MKKCRKRSLFKNDPFGIKQKIFMWRTTNHIKKHNHLVASQLECFLNIVSLIGIPRTEEDAIKLEKIYETYQPFTNEIKSNIKRVYDNVYNYRNE